MSQVALLFLCPYHMHLPQSKIPAIGSDTAKLQHWTLGGGPAFRKNSSEPQSDGSDELTWL